MVLQIHRKYSGIDRDGEMVGLIFSNFGLRVYDRYRTKEVPLQTESKDMKIFQIKLHCVASVSMVSTFIIGGKVGHDFIYDCSDLWVKPN